LLGNNGYVLSLVNMHTWFVLVKMLKTKEGDLVTDQLLYSVDWLTNSTGLRKGALRCDNREKLKSERLIKGLFDHQIGMQYTVPYWPATNGCAERMNANLLKKVGGMLKSSGLSVRLWGEMV
jgi:hypothetical protein